MKRAAWALIMIPALVWAMAGQTGPAKTPNTAKDNLASLVEAERAFAGAVETKGLRAGFLIFLADRAIIFNPRPVEGRPVYERMAPDNPGILSWRPEVAEVSTAGDMGYTSGPYEFRKSRDAAEPSGLGHYVSVWIKEADGKWKVFLDIGTAHAQPAKPPGEILLIPPSGPPVALGKEDRDKANTDLRLRASAFYETMIGSGFRRAVLKYATEDVRVLRPGHSPAYGLATVKRESDWDEGRMLGTGRYAGRGRLEGKVKMNSRLSDTGDLGVTYGSWAWTVDGLPQGSASYLWIWRRKPGGDWKLCLAVKLPFPRP
jgi:ketosteroid isomerase-like protein